MEADRRLDRDEKLVCNMCRAALHKHCGKWQTPQEICTCDCVRGY